MPKRRTHPGLARKGAAAAGTATVAGAIAAGKLARDRARRAKERRRAFRLDGEERAADGTRRIARGQIDDAIERLTDSGRDEPATAVHDARRSLKRLRAVVRTARDQLGTDVYRRENEAFRDAGRRFAAVRDAKVLVETLDALVERYADELPDRAFGGLRAALVAEQNGAYKRLEQDRRPVEETVADLEAAQARVATWPLTEDAGYSVLAPGLERIYRRGRAALRAALHDPTDDALHELRKRAKDLWHAAQIVRPVSPEMTKLARRAHRLSNVIGADHDLAVLRAAADQRRHTLSARDRTLLAALIDRRRARLQRGAMRRAKRLYKAKPRRLAKAFG